jgi:O-antigen/teichoic acid export membrane protein
MVLLRNAGFNFLGAALPAILAIVTIPYVVTTLGVGTYGLLVLVTSIVGYFALLDINVTAGSTKYVAQYHAAGDTRRMNETLCFGILIYGAIGIVGMICLWIAAPYLVAQVFKIAVDRQPEALLALQIAAGGFAIGQVQAYLQSLPGALMRFDISAQLEAGFGSAVPLATVALLYAGYGLVELVWLRVGASLLQGLLIWQLLRNLLPQFRWARPGKETRRLLLSFSAYSFLSRLAALTYANADKLIISARIGVAALTYYVVPTTLVNRVMSLIFRFSGVMFPHASSLAAQNRLTELKSDYLAASRYMLFINGAIALALATLASPILTLWLSPSFAQTGTAVMVMIAMAQWVDSLTNLPSLVNDGLGHPKVSGLFALGRAVFGLGLIAIGVSQFGIEGAAGAHLLAAIVMSTIFVWYVHGRTVPIPLREIVRDAYLPAFVALLPAAGIGYWLSAHVGGSWLHLFGAAGAIGSYLLLAGLFLVCKKEHRLALIRQLRWRKGAHTP